MSRILRAYKTCNSIVRFSKYKFNNKLLSNITVTLLIECNIGVSVIEILYIYIYIEREREREYQQKYSQYQQKYSLRFLAQHEEQAKQWRG